MAIIVMRSKSIRPATIRASRHVAPPPESPRIQRARELDQAADRELILGHVVIAERLANIAAGLRETYA